MIVWKRRRKNRYGRDEIPVKVDGRTPAGYLVIREIDRPKRIHAVHPKNVEEVEDELV